MNIVRSEGIRTILLELTETAKPKDSDFAADGDNLQRAGACVRANSRAPGTGCCCVCVVQGGGRQQRLKTEGADHKLKVQVLVTDKSGHGHGAQREQSSIDDGRLTSGMLLGKSMARDDGDVL